MTITTRKTLLTPTLFQFFYRIDYIYRGKYGDYFWHQNADQVLVYIPIDDELSKREIEIDFQARKVEVSIGEKEKFSFDCMERIIPDGSFWMLETDKHGKRHLQLDLEKR